MFSQFFLYSLFVFMFLFVAISLCCSSASADTANDQVFEQLRARYVSLLCLTRGAEDDPRFQKTLHQFDQGIEKELKAQILDPTHPLYGTWGDVEDEKSKLLTLNGFWSQHLRQLALAYSRASSSFYHNEEVLERVSLGLDGYAKWVYPGCPKPGNWWAWDIGMPMNLIDTFILLKDALPERNREFLKATLEHLIKKNVVPGLGANAIWLAWLQFRYGMATDNEEYLRWGYECLNRQSEIRPDFGDGIKPDYSYFFHSPGMKMGYGQPHYSDISTFLFVTQGTSYAMTNEAVHVQWFLQYIRWLMYKDTVDLYAWGRAGTRGKPHGFSTGLLESTLALVGLDLPEKEVLIAECGRMLPDFKEFFSLNYAPEQIAVERSTLPPTELSGFRFYPYPLYGVWRKKDFMVSIHLDSTRNKKWFSIHSENVLGHHVNDGHLAILTDADETGGGVLACQDWSRLTGITAAEGFVLKHDTIGQTKLTGGVSLNGEFGFVAMNLLAQPNADGPALHAAKSCFFLDDAVICLIGGACVEGASEPTPYTVLSQIPMIDQRENPEMIIDAKERLVGDPSEWRESFRWLHFQNRGVVNLSDMPVRFSFSTQSHPWSRINAQSGPTSDLNRVYSYRFLTAERIHESSDERFAFAILPVAKSSEVADWSRNCPVEILQFDDTAHVLRAKVEGKGSLLAAVVFKPDSSARVSASQPVIVLAKEGAGSVDISAMNLDASATGTVRVELPLALVPGKYGGFQVLNEAKEGSSAIEFASTGLGSIEAQMLKK